MTKSTQRKTWRDVLPIHPAAELFPLMSESELRELGEDIKKNGLQNWVTLCKYDNKLCVLDGRNRLDAMELVGLPTHGGVEIFRTPHGNIDPYEFVLAANIHRRHLTVDQKRDLIAKVLKAKPEASDRQIAQQTKTSPTTVGKIRKKSEASGDVSKLDTRTDTKGRKQPSAKPKKSVEKAKAAEVERDRAECIALYQKVIAAERELAEHRATGSQEDCPDCDTPQQRWEFSLRNLASDAISLSAFWSRKFGNWKSFNVSSDLVTLAKQAADAWKQLARELEDKAPHDNDDLSIPESLRRVAP